MENVKSQIKAFFFIKIFSLKILKTYFKKDKFWKLYDTIAIFDKQWFP